MNIISTKEDNFKIIKNATVIYIDDVKEQFEAIRLVDKGVIIGRILDNRFFDCGFISKRIIKKIRGGKRISHRFDGISSDLGID